MHGRSLWDAGDREIGKGNEIVEGKFQSGMWALGTTFENYAKVTGILGWTIWTSSDCSWDLAQLAGISVKFFEGRSVGSRGAWYQKLCNSSWQLVAGYRRLASKKMHIYFWELEMGCGLLVTKTTWSTSLFFQQEGWFLCLQLTQIEMNCWTLMHWFGWQSIKSILGGGLAIRGWFDLQNFNKMNKCMSNLICAYATLQTHTQHDLMTPCLKPSRQHILNMIDWWCKWQAQRLW